MGLPELKNAKQDIINNINNYRSEFFNDSVKNFFNSINANQNKTFFNYLEDMVKANEAIKKLPPKRASLRINEFIANQKLINAMLGRETQRHMLATQVLYLKGLDPLTLQIDINEDNLTTSKEEEEVLKIIDSDDILDSTITKDKNINKDLAGFAYTHMLEINKNYQKEINSIGNFIKDVRSQLVVYENEQEEYSQIYNELLNEEAKFFSDKNNGSNIKQDLISTHILRERFEEYANSYKDADFTIARMRNALFENPNDEKSKKRLEKESDRFNTSINQEDITYDFCKFQTKGIVNKIKDVDPVNFDENYNGLDNGMFKDAVIVNKNHVNSDPDAIQISGHEPCEYKISQVKEALQQYISGFSQTDEMEAFISMMNDNRDDKINFQHIVEKLKDSQEEMNSLSPNAFKNRAMEYIANQYLLDSFTNVETDKKLLMDKVLQLQGFDFLKSNLFMKNSNLEFKTIEERTLKNFIDNPILANASIFKNLKINTNIINRAFRKANSYNEAYKKRINAIGGAYKYLEKIYNDPNTTQHEKNEIDDLYIKFGQIESKNNTSYLVNVDKYKRAKAVLQNEAIKLKDKSDNFNRKYSGFFGFFYKLINNTAYNKEKNQIARNAQKLKDKIPIPNLVDNLLSTADISLKINYLEAIGNYAMLDLKVELEARKQYKILSDNNTEKYKELYYDKEIVRNEYFNLLSEKDKFKGRIDKEIVKIAKEEGTSAKFDSMINDAKKNIGQVDVPPEYRNMQPHLLNRLKDSMAKRGAWKSVTPQSAAKEIANNAKLFKAMGNDVTDEVIINHIKDALKLDNSLDAMTIDNTAKQIFNDANAIDSPLIGKIFGEEIDKASTLKTLTESMDSQKQMDAIDHNLVQVNERMVELNKKLQQNIVESTKLISKAEEIAESKRDVLYNRYIYESNNLTYENLINEVRNEMEKKANDIPDHLKDIDIKHESLSDDNPLNRNMDEKDMVAVLKSLAADEKVEEKNKELNDNLNQEFNNNANGPRSSRQENNRNNIRELNND